MFACFTSCAGAGRKKRVLPTPLAVNEKRIPYHDEPYKTRGQTVDELTDLFRSTSIPLSQLVEEVEDTVYAQGCWDELTAQAFLAALSNLILAGEDASPTFTHTLNRAIDEAKKIEELAVNFAGEHPVLTAAVLAILALGVLYLFWPAALDLLGFGSEGIIAGRYARNTVVVIVPG
jgi:hypothetical protein